MRTKGADEAGLGLVEVMVGLFITAIVLTALASTATATLQSLSRSERLTRATHVGNDVLEELSATAYEHLGLYTGEATAAFGAVTTFEGEDLVLYPDPSTRDERVPQPLQTLTRDDITYTVRTAIVWDDRGGSPESYKRIIVDLTWDVRGQARTARVEGLTAPTPEDQALSVSVIPEVIPLTDIGEGGGKNADAFTIDAVAIEPQSAVKVRWTARDGSTRETSMTADAQKLNWTVPFSANSRHFANGGTLFEVIATSADGTRQSTTIGRATFLHTLEIPGSRVSVDPSPLIEHPTTGYCTGLDITVDVVGAVLSDPLTIDLTPGETTTGAGALEPVTSIVDGARYQVGYDPVDLPNPTVEDGGRYVWFRLTSERTADLASAVLDVRVPVTTLTTDGSGEAPPCPTP